uniref:Intraflagellar transport 20 n=1 Tax=Sus scrofa TaxID=9823 RepID=A0A8D1AV02_PIG
MTFLLLAATVTPSEQNFSREAGRETGETQRGGGRGKGKPLEPLGFSLWCPGPGLGAGLEAGISLGGWAMIGIGAGFFTAMAKDILGEAGLHFDELNKLRVLDPEVTQQTIELKEECKDFVDKIGQFQKIVGGLIELVDQLAKEAENEKMKAIGARNLLKSIAKQREAQQQQLQALIAEKKMQLERYRVEYEALCKVEAEQNEFIDQFIFQK